LGERTGPGFGYDEVPDVVEKIVGTYLARRDGPETFLQTYRRIGMAPFKEALYAA
jgi:sulfite reductase (NADPH) hemoprotein beta-component